MENAPERFAMLLPETTRAWRNRLDKRLRPLGLSQAKWLAIYHLAHAGEGMTQKELAARLGVEAPTLVGLLDRLARDGLVERHESTRDRRSKRVCLSPKASAILQQINQVTAQLRQELLAGVTPEDLQTCIRVLQSIRDRAEAE
jgi:MarR family transcriptional regulator, transcriptional regulator for hemolysin